MRKLPRGFWPLLAFTIAIVPVGGVFTLSRLFVVRDLALTFHSRFLFSSSSLPTKLKSSISGSRVCLA